MRLLKRLAIILVLFVVAVGVAGFLLPSKIHVERSALVDAPVTLVYEQVAVLKNWEQWSPWHKMFPEAQYHYGEVARGVGATYHWSGKQAGQGTLRIVAADENKSLQTQIEYGARSVKESWRFEPSGEQVQVTWSFDANVGSNPIGRYLGLLMDSQVGGAFEDGLQDLKQVCESKASSDPSTEATPASSPAGNAPLDSARLPPSPGLAR